VSQPFPPSRTIAVDVDGTLHREGEPNARLIEWCRQRKAEGFRLMLWSARGEAHARRMAEACGCADLWHVITSKPGYIVDDLGWRWIQYTRVVKSDAWQES
jgi:ribonucleotide monophosphatase NagD (HAD superfamily)